MRRAFRMANHLMRRHEGHDSMSSADESMMAGMDDMNDGTLNVYIFPNVYLAIFGVVVACFAIQNLLQIVTARHRLREARLRRPTPSQPKNFVTKCYATLTAVSREFGNSSFGLQSTTSSFIPHLSVGQVALISLNFALLFILCFYDLNPSDYLSFQNLAYRCGFVSLGQIPVIFVLAGKNNIVGYLTGHSYERLNWLHRWCARCLLITVTMHMGYWFRDWAPYDFIGYELQNDNFAKTGFSAWCLLLWIVFSSFAPIRGWRYEFFVLQHIISMLAFTVVVFLHVPSSDWIYLWPAVAFLAFDRLVRTARLCWNSFMTQTTDGRSSLTIKATISPVSGSYVRVTVPNPRFSWSAGQHVFISFPSKVPLQNHPFTICSLPEDNKLEFLIQARSGATKQLSHAADKLLSLPAHTNHSIPRTVPVTIDGPYGNLRPLRQFDSVVLIAGGIGMNFTMPLLRDLVNHWKRSGSTATRYVKCIWVIKSRAELGWYASQLRAASEAAASLSGVSLEISIYMTCPDGSVAPPARDLKHATAVQAIEQIDPRSLSPTTQPCGDASGTCCCRTTILSDADAVAAADVICNCGSHVAEDSSGALTPTSSASSHKEKQGGTVMVRAEEDDSREAVGKHVRLFSGRPHPRSQLRGVLEQAEGESGVVVCGPRPLNDAVRDAVVRLSDERAVHKGTGAQGVWCHVEGFAY